MLNRKLFKDWKFLVLVILVILKAIQILDSSLDNKKNKLYILRKKESKLLLIQKEAKNLVPTLKKQKLLSNLNCKTVFVNDANGSLVNEETDIQNSISSFSRRFNIQLNSFNWGILTEDSKVKNIRYLPFSLALRGKVENFPKFLCYLISLKKLIIVDNLDFTILSNERFISNLNLKLVFVNRELCRK